MEKATCVLCQGPVDGLCVSLCACKGTMALTHIDCVLDQVAHSRKTECSVCKLSYVVKRDTVGGGVLKRVFDAVHGTESRRRAAGLALMNVLFLNTTMNPTKRLLVRRLMAASVNFLVVAVILCVALFGVTIAAMRGEVGGRPVLDLIVCVVVFFTLSCAFGCAVNASASKADIINIRNELVEDLCVRRPVVEPV